jgi:hypothetical protein
MIPPNQIAPEVPPEQKRATELIQRIRKLRWIGMDEEADLLQLELESCRVALADCVVALPRETD